MQAHSLTTTTMPTMTIRPPARVRLPYRQSSPAGLAAFEQLDSYVEGCGLEPTLLDLVRLRASLTNGCAYCVDMHTKDLNARGESTERVAGASVWEMASYYTERERAALAWCDAVTRVTLVVLAMNGWNRIVAAFRPTPGV